MIDDAKDIARFRPNRISIVRRIARDMSLHRDDPDELGFDIEDMQGHASDSPDRFIRVLATRLLTRRHFGPHRDPRRAAA